MKEEPDLEDLVQPEWIEALVGTSDLPSGALDEVAALLRRNLAAEGGHTVRAAARLQHQAKWRTCFGVPTEDEVPTEIAAGKVLVQPPPPLHSTAAGIDGDPSSCQRGAEGVQSLRWQQHRAVEQQQSAQQRRRQAEAPRGVAQGCPLVVVTVRKHFSGDSLDELERFVVLVLDTACHYAVAAPAGQLAALFDLRGVTMRNLHMAAVRMVFATLERHFPERLRAIYLLDASWVFHGAWHLIEPFIDANSRSKVRFLSGSEGRAALLQDLGPDVVPVEFGGQAGAVPIEVAARCLPAWQQAQQRQPELEQATQHQPEQQPAAAQIAAIAAG